MASLASRFSLASCPSCRRAKQILNLAPAIDSDDAETSESPSNLGRVTGCGGVIGNGLSSFSSDPQDPAPAQVGPQAGQRYPALLTYPIPQTEYFFQRLFCYRDAIMLCNKYNNNIIIIIIH
ncbi:hypothetical protein COCON_G00001150 [Conger conger]|uniref:Uncharacterized protein n=1 Tax=Conger conger TaxID=82655 RepID=A0A9Q1E0L3_CONCO|nr:hypothetical protein COCON_G00001150 [Conger conger]